MLNECIEKIQSLNYNKLRETLIPLLHKKEKLNIEEMKTFVIDKIKKVFILDENEKEFIKQFNQGNFNQTLLFGNSIKEDLSKHPMIIWKTQNSIQT